MEVESGIGGASFVYPEAIDLEGGELDGLRRLILADALARYQRRQGTDVLFATQIESGEETAIERLRRRCDALAVSCDWSRTTTRLEPANRRRTQRIFLELFEAQLIVHQAQANAEGGWKLRSGECATSCEEGLEELEGWTQEAREAQLGALGAVHGVEVEATLLGGPALMAFTPYPDAVSEAAFVAVSPNHAQLEALAATEDLRGLGKGSRAPAMIQTAAQAAVPGVEALLPVVITPAVDERYGPAAVLGIPSRDESDRAIAERLEARPSLPFRAKKANSKPTPAVRFGLSDLVVSERNDEGIPVPVVHCAACGPQAADLGESPPSEGSPGREGESRCPECGQVAEPDPEKITTRFAAMWGWSTLCVPPEERGSASLSHPELDRWLPASQIIWREADAGRVLDQRIAAKLEGKGRSEPFRAGVLCGPVRRGEEGSIGAVEELDELVSELGADVARLAILHAASPQRAASWSPASLRHAQRFLENLREYAAPRLRTTPRPTGIDPSTRLRRRFRAWCGVAEGKVAVAYEKMQMHRASFDLMLFLKRIQDFEERCAEAGGLSAEDEEAVAFALLGLIRLAAPCAPLTAADLEAIAEGGSVSVTGEAA